MKFRVFWGKVIYPFVKYLPPSFTVFGFWGKWWRRLCGRLILQKCGKKVNIEKGAEFSSRCSLGDYSGIGINARIQGTVIIGSNVMMAEDVKIFTRNHKTDRTDIPMMDQGVEDEKPVEIGDDVWIGAGVIILPGRKIGEGAIIGAGAVVTKDVLPYQVVGGNPARVLKERKTE